MPNAQSDVQMRRRIGGVKAKAFGQMFEQIFLLNCRMNKISVTRIPDSCRQLAGNRMIRVKSPFDWILTYQGRSAVIDTKTTEHDAFWRADIIEHQVEELLIHEQAGGVGGYIVWNRKSDLILFIPASLLEAAHQKKVDTPLNREHPQVKYLGTSQKFNLAKLFDT